MIPPTSIDGTDITGATIDGTDVTEITVDGQTVFTAGPAAPPLFNNLYHWWDFGAANSTTTFIEDQSNDNNDLTSGSFSNFDTINGRKAANFDNVAGDSGSTDYIRNSGAFAEFTYSFFIVVDVDDTSTSFQRVFHGGKGGIGLDFRVMSNKFDVSGAAADFGNTSNDTIVSIVNMDSSRTFEARTDGVSHGTITTNNDYELDNATFGARVPFKPLGDDMYDGSIGECLIYDGPLTSSEVDDIESFLAGKWNVTI